MLRRYEDDDMYDLLREFPREDRRRCPECWGLRSQPSARCPGWHDERDETSTDDSPDETEG